MNKFLAPAPLLKGALLVDAFATAASGLLQAAGSTVLPGLLGLPGQLLLWTGAFYLVYASAVGWAGTRPAIPAAAVWAIIACNVFWAALCVLALLSGRLAPTSLGTAYVMMQAAAVLAFAAAQALGARRAPEVRSDLAAGRN